MVPNRFLFCLYSAFPQEAGSRNNQPIPDNVTYKERDGDLHVSQWGLFKNFLKAFCSVDIVSYVAEFGFAFFYVDPDLHYVMSVT